jgi:phosphoglycolate phosphatase
VTPKLAIFDVDGTLVDSQAEIVAAMAAAFAAVRAEPPGRAAILDIVGLSLPQAIARLAPDRDAAALDAMVAAYKDAYADLRRSGSPAASPLYPGIAGLVERLHGIDPLLLGLATGKSRRGLDALLDSLGLRRFFVTTQCADDHPGKPHPAMLRAALAETGVPAADAVMIGDTAYDRDMAAAAGLRFIGVTWGYHRPAALAGATDLVHDAAALEGAILSRLEARP